MHSFEQETKVKGYINIHGYKVVADDTINPGRYGFRIIHDVNKSHAFASDEHAAARDWMKALMKATIDRDYTRMLLTPVLSANVANHLERRPCHFVCECSDHPTYHRASHEPRSSTTFADATRCGATSHACGCTDRAKLSRRAGADGRTWGWYPISSTTKGRLALWWCDISCAYPTVARDEETEHCFHDLSRYPCLNLSFGLWGL